MESEAHERQPDLWPGEEKTGNTLLPEKEVLESGEITDDPSFVKAAPIDIRGAWRKAFHCNYRWVVGHYMMYPCNSEREAERVCKKLQEEWSEA